jgi:hypothetical protein
MECVCMTKNMKKKKKKKKTRNTKHSLVHSRVLVCDPSPTSARRLFGAAHVPLTRQLGANECTTPTNKGWQAQNTQTEPVTFPLMIFVRPRCPPSAVKIVHQCVSHDNQQASGSPLACGVKSRAQGQVSHRCDQLALLRTHTLECGHTVNHIDRV